jgi:hypothetical protein
MPGTSPDEPGDYACLMLRAARLCETIRVAIRCLHRVSSPELFGVVKQAQPHIADGIRLATRIVGQALDLPLSPSLNTELIRTQELRDGVALEQFQASHGALSEELDRMAQHPALKDGPA